MLPALRLHVRPVAGVMLLVRDIELTNPFNAVRVTVEVPDEPEFRGPTVVGLAAIEKSGGGPTLTVIETE